MIYDHPSTNYGNSPPVSLLGLPLTRWWRCWLMQCIRQEKYRYERARGTRSRKRRMLMCWLLYAVIYGVD